MVGIVDEALKRCAEFLPASIYCLSIPMIALRNLGLTLVEPLPEAILSAAVFSVLLGINWKFRLFYTMMSLACFEGEGTELGK